MVAAMDAVGVDGAVLGSPFSMYRYDASYAKQVYAAHPNRFGLVKPVDRDRPRRSPRRSPIGLLPTARSASGCSCATPRIDGPCRPRPKPCPGGSGAALAAGQSGVHRASPQPGGRSGGPQSHYAARGRPPWPANSHRCRRHLRSRLPLCRSCWLWRCTTKHRGEDQRGLHTVPRAFPLQGSVGSARAASSTPLASSVACGVPIGPARSNLLTYEQGIEAFRVTDRLSDSDRARLMGGTLERVYKWAPSKAA